MQDIFYFPNFLSKKRQASIMTHGINSQLLIFFLGIKRK